jgi:hypothetical protein
VAKAVFFIQNHPAAKADGNKDEKQQLFFMPFPLLRLL